MATDQDKHTVRASHQELFQAITGEYTILGLVATTPPEEIVDRMLDGLDEPSPEWLTECDMTYEALMQLPAGERAFFLIAPLTSLTPGEVFERARRQAEATITSALGLPVKPPSEETFRHWKARAKVIEGKIPRVFSPRPAGVLALRWITNHLTARGSEASDAFSFKEIQDGNCWINTTACLPEPALDEGNMEEIATEKTARAKLFNRRYVKITRDDRTTPSFQQFACLALTPQAGFVFPGSEFINHAAGLREDIDFCIRVKATPADKAKDRNAKAERNLKDQYEQRSGDQGITGGNSELDKNAAALKDYVTALNVTDREVEIEASMIFAASGSTAAAAEDDMKELVDFYKSEEWLMDVPYGGQEKLFWDFWPGSAPSQLASEYTQVTTGRDFSMGTPLTNDALGMNKGFRIGINITTGRHSTVLMDLAGLAENDISGSFAMIGELGSGKSVGLKTVASHTLDRGAQLVAVDHSDNQEWAALARSLTTANVIDFLAPNQSLDPVRMWGNISEKKRQTLKLMTMMLGLDSEDHGYALIDGLLDRLFEGGSDVANLSEILVYLEEGEFHENDKETARRLAAQLRIFAKLDFAQTFFNPDLPVMDFSYQATVFCTHGMELPTQDELFSSGNVKLSLEKKMGRASYAYLAEVGSHIMYEDDSQEVLFLVDEAHHMTGSPEGAATIKKALKTGRKHKSAVGLGTHSADELGDEDLRGLIPQRFVFRTRDKQLAVKNLRWLDETYATDLYVDMLTKDTAPLMASADGSLEVPMYRRGEALYRDPLNRIGKIKVEIPRNPDRQKTVLTSPPKRRLQGAGETASLQKAEALA
ncbi:ATP-binding protein [Micrococcaceae sp. AOP34-BR2-30]